MNTSKNNGVFFHLLSIMFITIFLACSTIDNNNDAVNLSNEHSKIKHTEIKEFQYAQFKKMKSNETYLITALDGAKSIKNKLIQNKVKKIINPLERTN